MTLHWWMHWFWVTKLLFTIVCSGTTIAVPPPEILKNMTTDAEVDPTGHPGRQSKALYYDKPPQISSTKPTIVNTTERNQTAKKIQIVETKNITENITDVEIAHPAVVQWTPVNTTIIATNTTANNITKTNENTTLPPSNNNATELTSSTTISRKRNITRVTVKDDLSSEGLAESKIVTEKPLSLETAFVQTKITNQESSKRILDPYDSGMDTGAIAGISFAALVLTTLAGSTAFVLYRRRFLNKPQTLNDKCSNPDSSGYLDDSTIRDNSEEMYSLDNDSFLNSLEAMTIQNYWTDTVKHTKL